MESPAHKLWRRNRQIKKLAFVARWKKRAGCIDCGFADPRALDFDHINGDKRRAVSTLAQGNWAMRTVITEMEKCVVRCSNCHRIRTRERAEE